jgi:putative DNA-invertase from lambdoid prophage Rac
MSKIVGYLRVSTLKDQTTDNQEKVMLDSGLKVDEFFIERGVSGSVPAMERPAFKRMLKSLVIGDCIVCTKIDRLGRSASDILNTIAMLKVMQIKVRIMQFDGIDITSSIGKMLMTCMAAVSELERNLIQERVVEGLDRTKSQGTILGAPKTALKSPEQILQLSDMLKKGELTQKQIAEQMEISLSTLKRLKLEWVDTKKQKEYIKLCGKQAVQIVANRN